MRDVKSQRTNYREWSPLLEGNIYIFHSTHIYLPMKMEQCVPKHRHINSKCRGITQKKAYNIQNTAKA